MSYEPDHPLNAYAFHLSALFVGSHHHVLQTRREVAGFEVASWRRVAKEALAAQAVIPHNEGEREKLARCFARRLLDSEVISEEYWQRTKKSWYQVVDGYAKYSIG